MMVNSISFKKNKKTERSAVDPVILFCCDRLAPTLELAHVMRALAEAGESSLAILGSENLDWDVPVEHCHKMKKEYLAENISRIGPITIPRLLQLMNWTFRFFRLKIVADAVSILRSLVIGNIASKRLMNRYKIKLVVVADDRNLGWPFGMVAFAKRNGIPTLAIPFALSDPSADWLARKGRRSFEPLSGWYGERWIKQSLSRRYPENIRTEKNIPIMFLTAGQLLALKVFNCLLKTPWAYGGGITDISAVYGEADRIKQIGLGVPASKLVVTGQCSMDKLKMEQTKSDEVRNRVVSQNRMLQDRKIIVCAIPQYFEHNLLDGPQHWVLTEQMLKSFADTNANVFLSLHPRSHRKDYESLAQRFGAVLLTSPLLEILPIADLFVATSNSSTLRWAILLKIPAIGLCDIDLDNGPMHSGGIQLLEDRSQLACLCQKTLENTEMRKMLQSTMEKHATLLDPFDGKNCERTIDLIMKMTKSTKSM